MKSFKWIICSLLLILLSVPLFGQVVETRWVTFASDVFFDATVYYRNTLTVGEDDTGYDVKFFGATSGCYWLWDESADMVSIVNTSATTTGTDRVFNINMTQTGASATKILEAFRVNIDANVMTGDWVNAIVARVDYGAVGDAAGGMVAPFCSELSLPAKTPAGGMYIVADLELDAPTNHLNHGNSAYPTAFLNMAIWGDATAIASEEDYAYFFRTDGFTGAAGNMVSLTAHTMRILAENSAGTAVTRYLVLSQTEDGIGLGTSGTPQVVTYNGAKPLSIYTTCASTSSTSYEPVLFYTTLTGEGQTGGRVRSFMTTNVALGGWSNALKAEVTYGTAGRTTGLGSAFCAEMTLSAGTSSGTYAPVEIELNMGSAGVTGTQTSLIHMSVNDAAATTFDDLGYLFNLSGVTAGTSGSDVYETSASIGAVDEITAGLRVKIKGIEYYLLMCTPTDIQD